MLSGKEIREKYLSFFERKMHKVYESASLIPDDPTMLLTIAGMVPFKPFFLGYKEPPYTRIASCQKCIRTNDIENVGRTARHHTFFEMLGNFAFGDYFKEEAILFAWEFITEELKMPKDNLWISVYEDDDESIKIWNEKAGVSLDRIVRLGASSNFWSAGPTGSCGPCSEIYVDLGESRGCGPDCKLGCDCDRFLEIWNLVFTEYNRLEDGTLEPLPKKNIDTGMGLERITSVIQKVESNFETDLLKPILDAAAKMAGITYKNDANKDFSLRVITDHTRAFSILINDGVLPSNDGRGYVLRRILRRASRHGRLIGLTKPFLYQLVDVVVDIMAPAYPELKANKEHIKKVILTEEEKFEKTLDQGIALAGEEIEKLKKAGKSKIDAEVSFKLYDTYGFPYELTEEICNENKIEINHAEFKQKMEEQRAKARSAREVIKETIEDEFIADFYAKNGKTVFTGYEKLEETSEILYIEDVGDGHYDIILRETPFYAESGGQVADTGVIGSKTFTAVVRDVQKRKDIFIHRVELEEGNIELGDKVTLKVDKIRRESIKRNHTATHLLQAALIEVIGNHVHQAGSLVTQERLRFDFSHYLQVKEEELEQIERIVNNKILEALNVNCSLKTMDEAKAMGATALFGDKYGDIVRVVEVEKFSTELCGGTHVSNTGEIGLFKIVTETGIAAGTRRIEAITGLNSLKYIYSLENRINDTAEILKCDGEMLKEKAAKTVEELKKAEKEAEKLAAKLTGYELQAVYDSVVEIKGIKVLVKAFDNKDVNALRDMIDRAKDKLKSCVVLFGANNGNAIFLAGVTKDLTEKGLKAGDLVKEAAAIAGGNGGGRPDFAQAGGKDGSKTAEACAHVLKFLESKI